MIFSLTVLLAKTVVAHSPQGSILSLIILSYFFGSEWH